MKTPDEAAKTTTAMRNALLRALVEHHTTGLPLLKPPTRRSTINALMRRHLATRTACADPILNRYGLNLARRVHEAEMAHLTTTVRAAGITSDQHVIAPSPHGPGTVVAIVDRAYLAPDPTVVIVDPDGDERSVPLGQVHPLPYLSMIRDGHRIDVSAHAWVDEGITLTWSRTEPGGRRFTWSQEHADSDAALEALGSQAYSLTTVSWERVPVVAHRFVRDTARAQVEVTFSAAGFMLIHTVTDGVRGPVRSIEPFRSPRVVQGRLRHLVTFNLSQGWTLDTDTLREAA